MKLLITGAGGFLGRHVVAAAVARGHTVRALIRPAARNYPPSWQDHPQVEVARADLRAPHNLETILEGIDCVLHLAAAKSGDLYEQFGGTVLATENLLNAMLHTNVRNLVLISSFAVYEYQRRKTGSVLDETSPLAADPTTRDEYCQTKLAQERLVRETAHKHGWLCTVLRPGVVYGRDNLWTARLGMQLSSRWWLRIGGSALLPLTYVENCAEATVLAAERNSLPPIVILNVVDDSPPTQRAYLAEIQRRTIPRPHVLPIPWALMSLFANTLWLINRVGFKGEAKIPGLLVPARLHARCKPLRYPNQKIKDVLGWHPRYSWQEGVARSVEATDTADLSPVHPTSSSSSSSPNGHPTP